MRVVVLVLFVALAGWWTYDAVKKVSPEARRKSLYSALTLLFGGILVLAVVRFGFHWITVLAAGAFALLRRLFPVLIRMVPFAKRTFSSRGSPEAGDGEGQAPPRARPGAMSRSEALEILGLKEGASREQILAAYKSLIKKVHPDVPGGSTYLAQQINRAKSVLLGD